ncbi:DinB family protein [Pedobacter sp. Leaf176]|uniref:DinB family protein n=1 Tax=Pedobacter sp. Leaf176 TaxID=1736286 RepID=UPI0006FB502A|nr:DinB family protein [Pedobacter sp. Leaf176]KQR72399.1 hypothetical protein ASF92_03685 [Pedobacter sp. Leaf176]
MLHHQYNLVLSSRAIILDYIENISEEDFLSENSTFGRGSIRNLLVHIGDTYASWIAERALKKEIIYKPFDDYSTLADCLLYFNVINGYVRDFLDTYESDYLTDLEIIRNGTTVSLSPLKLFTHVITHEFHHKGQMMSLSRHLGYIPVDADIIH